MAVRKFIGRVDELAKLRRAIEAPQRPQITAIYGRRRVGKTRLVKEAYKEATVLHFEGLEGEDSSAQKRQFVKTLYRASKLEAHRLAASDDWADLFILLAEYVSSKPCVVFFDELQWMAAGATEFVSKLKYVWDNYFLENSRVHLVLCGSITSFLVNKVIRSKALYGRIDNIIHLRPLSFGEVRAGFFGSRSVLEALEYYLVVGGVPKYLEFVDVRKSVRLNLMEHCFTPDAYFVGELDRLFISHFGKTDRYRKIVEILASTGFAGRGQLGAQLEMKSGGRLTELLEDLVLAGFVESYGPLHNVTSTHLKRYRLADPYLRFYFKFIEPLVPKLEKGAKLLPHEALPDNKYHAFLGHAFEHFCYRHAAVIAQLLGFSAVSYDFGSWYRKSDMHTGAQIDLLFKRADKVITVCEVKHRQKVGREVIAEVQSKLSSLEPLSNRYSLEPVLISALPPTEDLVTEGYFSRILTAEDFANKGDVVN